MSWQDLLNTEILGYTVEQYAVALLFVLLGFISRWIAKLVIARIHRLAGSTDNRFDDAVASSLERPLGWALVLTGIWAAMRTLPLPVEPFDIARFANAMIKSTYIALAVWFFFNLISQVGQVMMARAKRTDSVLDDQFIPVVRNSLRVFVLLVGGATILQELGYSIGSLLAGVGLGGAALALAAKDTLANLFGSVVIFVDRPFVVGDWVEIGSIEGTVEEVGLRVTRIRTFANSLITLPNAELTTKSINNWSRMKKRRIKMNIGLSYDSSPEQMRQAVDAIRKLLREDEAISQDFWLVNFHEFGDSSLNIFLYAFTTTTVWAEYLQAREDLLLKIMGALDELGLEIAFPTRTVHIAGMAGGALPGEGQAMQSQAPA